MADRAANREGVATRLAAFARSVLLLVGVAVGVPGLLVFAARERFGGGAPFHGVPSPADWSADRIRSALTDRLTDQTIADIVIRAALTVAWVAVAVLVLTVIAEVVHMVRHDGLAMPDIRGFGLSQRTARVIASGLLVIVPLFTSPASVIAKDSPSMLPGRAVAAPVVDAPPDSFPGGADSAAFGTPTTSRSSTPRVETPPAAPVASGEYVVKPGDSVFGIAERLAGPESANVASFAEQLVDLNLGRQMPDGRHFNNAAFIDVGWVLELPDAGNVVADPVAATSDVDPAGVHVVERGESLWSIADDELGDPLRWPEVYDANEGRTFADGRSLVEPDLIQPGWDLRIPVDEVVADVAEAEVTTVEPLTEVEPPPPAVPDVDTGTPDVPERLTGSLDPNSEANADAAVGELAPARRDNVWDAPAVSWMAENDGGAEEAKSDAAAMSQGGATAGSGVVDPDDRADGADQSDESGLPSVLMLGSAAMLSAGVLTLLAVRRRNQLRRARPRATLPEPEARPAATERALRAIGAGERFTRVETGVRAAAPSLVDHGQRVLACAVGADGALELTASGPAELPGPWEGEGASWHLAASTPVELIAETAAGVADPCPTLVQLGTDPDGRDVYVDLEAIEAIEVGGPGAHADSIVAAIAATLAGSLLAEVTTLIGLGVPDDAFLGHRLYTPVRDGQRAFEAAADAIGSTASMTTSTFDLRTRGTAGETWEPAVVLAGAAAGSVNPPGRRTGLAVVSASPIHGPSSRLAPDGDAWLLLPAGIRLTPVGLTPDDIGAIAELVTVIEPEPEPEPRPQLDRAALTDDHTIAPPADNDAAPAADDHDGATGSSPPAVGHAVSAVRDDGDEVPEVDPPPPHALLVRLLGPVDVIDADGSPVTFERSKTRELVAWLATHRERSTRSAARTALWELDVRDATFANVVSEARRSLARLTEPPEGEEWVGRTMTDALPLHPLVLTDVDLIRHALDAARLQPPALAIATLAPAVDLIAGMPFEGTSYLWPDSEGITSNLVLLATTATTELAAHCLSIGDIEGVFRATGRGLQVLPAHEELIGLRMEAHARAGDHAGVRQEWESYERVINADPWSDGEPAPKLVELRQRLLNPSR